jgi:hypothetical protein
MVKAESHLDKYIEISLFRSFFEIIVGKGGCTVKTLMRLVKLIKLGGTTENKSHFVLKSRKEWLFRF